MFQLLIFLAWNARTATAIDCTTSLANQVTIQNDIFVLYLLWTTTDWTSYWSGYELNRNKVHEISSSAFLRFYNLENIFWKANTPLKHLIQIFQSKLSLFRIVASLFNLWLVLPSDLSRTLPRTFAGKIIDSHPRQILFRLEQPDFRYKTAEIVETETLEYYRNIWNECCTYPVEIVDIL